MNCVKCLLQVNWHEDGELNLRFGNMEVTGDPDHSSFDNVQKPNQLENERKGIEKIMWQYFWFLVDSI